MKAFLCFRLPQNWGLGGLLVLLALRAAAVAAPPAVTPPAQSQCFQLQYLLRLPNLEALHLIRGVAGLRDVDATDDATGNRRVAALSAEAAGLRRDEAGDFTRLARLMRDMAAPPALQAWAAARAEALGKPLPPPKDAPRDPKADPQVVALLATLDEADALKSDTDAHLTALAAWLSLTRGPAGLWAGDVGELTAALHVASVNHEAPRLSADTVRRLSETAPASAPAAARAALAGLLPKGGNLSALATAAPITQDPQAVSQAQDALLTAFSAQSLEAADAKAE